MEAGVTKWVLQKTLENQQKDHQRKLPIDLKIQVSKTRTPPFSSITGVLATETATSAFWSASKR